MVLVWRSFNAASVNKIRIPLCCVGFDSESEIVWREFALSVSFDASFSYELGSSPDY